MENKKEYILVTGASSGIGREVAIKLSQKANVVLNGRDQQRLEEVKSLTCKSDQQIIWNFDLGNVEELEKSFAYFMDEHNIVITHFVHCAGFMKNYPVKMINYSLFNATFNINVVSAALLVKVLMNRKINNKHLRSVVFISSNISNFGAKAFSMYGASKGALDSLMRSLAVELAPDVRINSVLPGGVRTAMTEHIYQDEELIKRMQLSYPLGLGDVEDIYEAVDFLLSDKSKWITGQQLTVDGGRTVNISG